MGWRFAAELERQARLDDVSTSSGSSHGAIDEPSSMQDLAAQVCLMLHSLRPTPICSVGVSDDERVPLTNGGKGMCP